MVSECLLRCCYCHTLSLWCLAWSVNCCIFALTTTILMKASGRNVNNQTNWWLCCPVQYSIYITLIFVNSLHCWATGLEVLFHVLVNVTGTLLKCPRVHALPLTVQLGRRLFLAQVVYGPTGLVLTKPGLQQCLLCCTGAFPSIQLSRYIQLMLQGVPVIQCFNAIFNISIHGLKLTVVESGRARPALSRSSKVYKTSELCCCVFFFMIWYVFHLKVVYCVRDVHCTVWIPYAIVFVT